MKRGSGKAKGSAFERMVCERLSLCITKGKNRDVFWRSAMSGGRGTLLKRRGKEEKGHQAGDITSTAPEGHRLTNSFYLECKFYKDLSLLSFFLGSAGRGSKLATFWEETRKQAGEHHRIPILFAKQNNIPTLVLTTSRQGVGTGAIPGASSAPYLCFSMAAEAYVYEFDRLFPPTKDKTNASLVSKRPALNGQTKRRVPVAGVQSGKPAVKRAQRR